MEALLSSPFWPLGSVFLSLINAHQTPCTSFPSVITHSKPEHTHSSIDLDGSPISDHVLLLSSKRDPCLDNDPDESSDSEEARNLETLLRNSDNPPNKKPSLSDRLTSPASASSKQGHNSYRFKGGSSKQSQRWIQSFRRTNLQNNLHSNSSPTSKAPPTNLANRLNPVPEPFRTSSNRIECTSRSFRSWGPATSHKPSHSDHLDSSHSNKPSRSYHHPNSHFNSPPSSQAKTNDLHIPQAKSFDHWERSNQNRFQDDTRKKKRSKLNSIDWDWSHWTNAAYNRPENKSHDNKSEIMSSAKKISSPQLSDSCENCSPSLCDSVDARANATLAAVEWQKKEAEENLNKIKNLKLNITNHHLGIHNKKQKTSPQLDPQDTHSRHQTNRLISPTLSSSQGGSVSSRSPIELNKDYFRLPPLHPALKDSIKRAVYSWINQILVETFWKIGIWFEDKKKWKADQWGAIRADQLEIIVDLYYPKGLNCLLRACKTNRFSDLFIKPVHSGLFFLNKDTQTSTDHLKLTKDFTPIGLLYRPIIKGLRRHQGVTGKHQIKIENFVRSHLLHSEEEDLIYLFQDDDDPYGCIKRAAQDGIIEVYEEEDDHYNYEHSAFGTRGGFSEHSNYRHNHTSSNYGNHKRKRLAFEDKFIALAPHWLSNKDLIDLPSVYSPTISQGGSSGVLPTEEEPNDTTKKAVKILKERNQIESSELNAARSKSKKEKSEPYSKASSTSTDGSDQNDQQENKSPATAEEEHQKEQQQLNQLPKNTPLHNELLLNRASSHQKHVSVAAFSSPDDDRLIDSIIHQFRKDISAL